MKSLNQWHGMVWKRLPWFDLVSIKGVNSKNMFFPNLHVFRINFISKKKSSVFYPPLLIALYNINLFATLVSFRDENALWSKHFSNPFGKLRFFTPDVFFWSMKFGSLETTHWQQGEQGLGTPLLRSFTLFCRLRWTFKVFQANLLLSWQRPHTVRNGNFL